jgi:dTDP-4-amino-4,6-dideoxygalactose transaminase
MMKSTFSKDMAERKGASEVEKAPVPSSIYVTRTFLPPRAEFDAWMDKVYASHVLTNNGPIHKELEDTLRSRFEVPYLSLMANGTLALQLAIRALGVKGQVITTPFSYVATTSAILWEGCEPVFVDIDSKTCCIDPDLIEAAITPNTSAILATHVYGIPCDVEAIDVIAKKHGLKVIYDAAHAFDVEFKGKSILAYGDASTLSFHATKLFHTVEGGAVVVHDQNHEKQLGLLRSFGHIYDEHYCLGINAKMSEVHAAMGMAVLPHIEATITNRRKLAEQYDALFAGHVMRTLVPEGTVINFSYYPILLESKEARENVMASLAIEGVHARRYFNPSLNQLPYLTSGSCPISEHIADRVMCLPLYAELDTKTVQRISEILLSSLQKGL